jgi:catechol 2,3-dioxygenase-like lactoylglutathione lyase family enzyme
MERRALDHVNIFTRRLPETIDFYSTYLGLSARCSPNRPDMTRGAWLVDAGGRAVLHLMTDNFQPATIGAPEPGRGGGTIHHVAFQCDGYDDARARMEEDGLAIGLNDVAAAGLRQIFVRDPNEILVELNFRDAY